MGNNIILNLAFDVLAVLVPALVFLGIELLRRKLGIEKMHQVQKDIETKQKLALLAVRFVEQVYQELQGAEKYNLAAEWLSEQAKTRGIKLSPQEIKGLIESSLRMIKDELRAEWADYGKKAETPDSLDCQT